MLSISKSIFLFLIFALLSVHKVYAMPTIGCVGGTNINIVAHADDDLLFLNPDILHDIKADICVLTLVATAGDANLDSSYWFSRESGLKAAYANMANVENTWVQSDDSINNHTVKTFKLVDKPTVSIGFLRLPDGNWDGSGFSNNGYESLQKLWTGNISSINTLDSNSSYTKESLIETLNGLMQLYSTQNIRTQNYVDSYSEADHSDHYTIAYFVNEASKRYQSQHNLLPYFDYETQNMEVNVFGEDLVQKQNAFMAYAANDNQLCQTLSECMNRNYGQWLQRQYQINKNNNSSPNELLQTGWNFSANSGSIEKDLALNNRSFSGTSSLEIKLNLHGATFGTGEDEASIIFIQDNLWKAVNITRFVQNGSVSEQTVTIPLTAFSAIGDPNNRLDINRAISNLHVRFWNNNFYNVDILSIKLSDEVVFTPTPVVTPTPSPLPTPVFSRQLIQSPWIFNGDNGSVEKDQQINSNSLSGVTGVRIRINLNGNRFGLGEDEASLIFIQNNTWKALNIINYIENGSSNMQQVDIPITAFRAIGNSINVLDVQSSVSNLHARFWHNNTFNVVIDGIELITSEVDQSPSPTNNSVRLINSDWNLSANNGSSELDTQIPDNAFQNKSKVKIKIDLRGKSFGSGIDEASIIFIQNGDWYAVNITGYVENGKNGSQEITIPLDRFKKINDSSQLDLSKTISNLHTRFWSDSSFDIEISVIDLE